MIHALRTPDERFEDLTGSAIPRMSVAANVIFVPPLWSLLHALTTLVCSLGRVGQTRFGDRVEI